MAGIGYWELSRDQLDRFRRAVDDPDAGGELSELVASVRRAGNEVLGSELERASRGYDPAHPRSDLLRHKRLAVTRAWPVEPWMHTIEAYDRVTQLWRDGTPVAAWLETNVGAALEPRRRRGG
jgi:uncharacterized protein (DUF2461 family)